MTSDVTDGQAVVDLWGGFADRDAGHPWERDTLVITFSTTKGVTAACCNRLIEQGRLDPDAPVAQYWPEFAANGKADVPVKWVLSHRAGLAHCVGTFTLDEVMAIEPVVRALGAETVARATTLLSDGTDTVLGIPTAFGLGFTGTAMLPPGVGQGAFGHAGAGGSLGFADADADAGIGFGYVMNQMQLGMTGDQRTQTLARAVYSSVG